MPVEKQAVFQATRWAPSHTCRERDGKGNGNHGLSQQIFLNLSPYKLTCSDLTASPKKMLA